MFEWSHLYFADQFVLDLSIAEYNWQQFGEVRQEDFHLVMYGGVKCGQCETVVAYITVMEHVDQKRYDQRPQDIIECIGRISESVTESRYHDTTDGRVLVG